MVENSPAQNLKNGWPNQEFARKPAHHTHHNKMA